MFTQDTTRRILESNYNNTKVFDITTNIAVGRGLNGTSYPTYKIGLLSHKKNDYGQSYIDEKTRCTIIEIEKEYIVIKINYYRYTWRNSRATLIEQNENILYLPYESIVSCGYVDAYENNYYKLEK